VTYGRTSGRFEPALVRWPCVLPVCTLLDGLLPSNIGTGQRHALDFRHQARGLTSDTKCSGAAGILRCSSSAAISFRSNYACDGTAGFRNLR
jgi:hypothetical protein